MISGFVLAAQLLWHFLFCLSIIFSLKYIVTLSFLRIRSRPLLSMTPANTKPDILKSSVRIACVSANRNSALFIKHGSANSSWWWVDKRCTLWNMNYIHIKDWGHKETGRLVSEEIVSRVSGGKKLYFDGSLGGSNPPITYNLSALVIWDDKTYKMFFIMP